MSDRIARSCPPLVLATGSPYRIELMGRLGLPFVAEPHRFDEDSLKTDGTDPVELARNLAVLKAKSLRELHPGAIIIGSDQVADLDGSLLGKPGSEPEAVAQLERMNGRWHRLITALALLYPDSGMAARTAVEITRLNMRKLNDREIEDYVRRDQPLNCAGSYRIESLGIALFDSIEGSDFTAIVGLPLISLVSMLKELGIPVLGR